MLTTIILNTVLGTLPILGPIVSGIIIGFLTGKKDLAVAVSFLGAIIGGVFCRIAFVYFDSLFSRVLLSSFGQSIAHYTERIITGNLFSLVIYFGLTGIAGAFIGNFMRNKVLNRLSR